MKKLTALLFLFVSSINIASTDSHTATLSLSLGFDEICNTKNYNDDTDINGEITICSNNRSIKLGGDKIELEPQDGKWVCNDDTGECGVEGATHYKGIWSKVIEKGSNRSIGIVTVDKHIVAYDDGTGTGWKKDTYFNIVVEILGVNGLEAKMKITTPGLNKISTTELLGKGFSYQRRKFMPYLTISSPIVYPCDGQVCDPIKKNEMSTELLLGKLAK